MADETVWTPQVQKKDHPHGEQGVVTSLEEVAKRVALGASSPKVRMWAIECLDRARKERGWKMDTEKERAVVLLEACQSKLWVPDPVGVEWMAGAHLMACDPEKDGVCFRGNDCFPKGTLMLSEGHELTPVESLKPGMKIWGLDRWSEVEAVEYKGYLPIDVITLNNGSEVKLTSDHHVYVLDCQKHLMLDDGDDVRALPEDRGGCSCDAEHRVEKRCRVSELREGMVLPTPDRIPIGTRKRDRALVTKIEREVLSVPCWDIQTDDHRVYLAEHDVTVSQCDDLVILLGSCLSSVGIYTAIVGHAYDKGKNISHVLCSAWVNGRWQYADPSTDLPLGECVRFTRERVYSVPNIKMICDSNMCFTHPRRFDPEMNDFVGKGGFVGVSGVPKFAWLAEPNRNVSWLGGNLEDTARRQAANRLDAHCDSLPSECAKRVCRQIVQKQGGTSEDDLESYTKTGAACGAEAACTYFGVPPGASSVCGRIGAIVGGIFFNGSKLIFSKIGNLFTRRNNKAKKFKKRIEKIRDFFHELDGWIEDIRHDQLEATYLLHELINKNLELYNQVSPVKNLTRQDLAVKLHEFGLPIATYWRPFILSAGGGVRNGGSMIVGLSEMRNQSHVDQLNDRFDMIMSPEWDTELAVYLSDHLDWGTLSSRDAMDKVEAEYDNLANKYNQIHDQIIAWVAQLEVFGAALTAYVSRSGAANATSRSIQEERERRWPICKSKEEAEVAWRCLVNQALPECKGAPRTFFEVVDTLPYCDGTLTQAEKDLLALAELIALSEAVADKKTKKTKKSSAFPMVLFGLAAAGAAWWLL